MKLSKTKAKQFLDAFDEVDKDGKLMKVAGGLAQFIILDRFIQALLPADEEGVESVDVQEVDYYRFHKAIKEFKNKKGEFFFD